MLTLFRNYQIFFHQASRTGAQAVVSLLKATPETETKVICLIKNQIEEVSLMECVENTLEVAKAIEQKDFQKALQLRGPYVYVYLQIFHNFHNEQTHEYGYTSSYYWS